MQTFISFTTSSSHFQLFSNTAGKATKNQKTLLLHK